MSDEYTRFKIIKDILSVNKKSFDHVQLWSRDFDDCALIKKDETCSIATSTDFVRGTWFMLFEMGYMNYFDVGYYLGWANISDVATMWARPLWLSVWFQYIKDMSDNDFKQVLEWINAICEKYNTPILGWDIWSYESNVLCATVLGEVETKNALLRKNSWINHVLCVTGNLWDAVASMAYFKAKESLTNTLTQSEEDTLLYSWRRLEPRVEEGMLLNQNFSNVWAQDISDGFKATLEQHTSMCEKNYTIYEDKIPVSSELKKVAILLWTDYLSLALSGSVDFELLVSIDRDDYKKAKNYSKIRI
jgi:thiamine-monophosphate kinase